MPLTALPAVCNCDGSLAQAFYNSNPDCTLPPVWVPHVDIKGDLNFNNSIDKTEDTPRGEDVCFKTYISGKGDLEITFDIGCSMNYEGNDVIVQMAKCGNVAPRDWLFLNRPLADADALGFRGCFSVFNFSMANPATGASQVSISMAPASVCLGCACPVQMVKADGLGDVDVLSVPEEVSMLRALSPELKSLRTDSLVSMQGSLALTLSDRVAVEVDDIIAAMHLIGKTPKNIETDFSQVAVKAVNFIKLRGFGTTKGYIQVYKSKLNAMLAEILSALPPSVSV